MLVARNKVMMVVPVVMLMMVIPPPPSPHTHTHTSVFKTSKKVKLEKVKKELEEKYPNVQVSKVSII